MAAVACSDDDFGKLFADVHLKDSRSLRGFGSLHWTFEDEPDIATSNRSWDTLPVAGVRGCLESVKGCLQSCAAQSNCGNNGDDFAASDAQNAVARSGNVETDSEDDLRIVLNPAQKEDECTADDSEDGEDFVVLTGNDESSGRGWPETALMASQEDIQGRIVGGDKAALSKDEQLAGQKAFGTHSRICYGSQAFRRHYRYVRANATGRVEAIPIWRARAGSCKGRFARSRSLGSHGGFSNFRRVAWGPGTVRGLLSGPEYILPPNKTVFDVDIDAFKEKPWRLPDVDLSDYFNFNLNETSWKEHCKRLAQFSMEVATQSKISVYESGRVAQSAAGDAQAGARQQPSTNAEKQQFRDSDAIFLIDAKESGIPQTVVAINQADIRDACKVSDSCGVNMSSSPESNICVLEKEQPSVKQRTQMIQKKSCAILKNSEPQESGTVVAVSRLQTPSPATPPERLPTRGQRYLADSGAIQHSSPDLSPQTDHNTGASCKMKETMEPARCKAFYGSQSLNAAEISATQNDLNRRKDSKRGLTHALGSEVIKKCKLDSHQANHGCRFASLLIKKFSRLHATKVISASQAAQPTLQGTGVAKTIASVFPSEATTSKNLVDGCGGEHVAETAEKVEKMITVNSNNLNGKSKQMFKEVEYALHNTSGKIVKEKSSKKLRANKSEKCLKGKKRMKSKNKVHAPGCSNFKKGLEKNVGLQEMGNMSMISFVSKDSTLYWKMASGLCPQGLDDSDAENVSVIYKCHESNQRIEDSSFSVRSNVHCANSEEDRMCSKRNSERFKIRRLHSIHEGHIACNEPFDDNVLSSSDVSKSLFCKKNCVKCMFRKDSFPASTKTELLANSNCGTQLNSSKQVLIKDQATLRTKSQLFEDKIRDSVGRQLNLESKCKVLGLAGSGHCTKKRCKKHHKNFAHKMPCQKSTNSNHLVDSDVEQSNAFIRVTNNRPASKGARKLGSNAQLLHKSMEASLQSCQTESFSTQVEIPNEANSTMLCKRAQKVENQVRRSKALCQETKSFWAFSI